MAAKVNIGPLTQEETAELLQECIAALPVDAVFGVLCSLFTEDEREELIASLELKRVPSADQGAKS